MKVKKNAPNIKSERTVIDNYLDQTVEWLNAAADDGVDPEKNIWDGLQEHEQTITLASSKNNSIDVIAACEEYKKRFLELAGVPAPDKGYYEKRKSDRHEADSEISQKLDTSWVSGLVLQSAWRGVPESWYP